MAVASRSIRSSGFSFKGIFFTGLGILLIVGLFFIPEIIQLQRTISGTADAVGTMKTLQTAAVSVAKDPKDTQLNRIASLIDSGYLEHISSGEGKKPEEAKPSENAAVGEAAKVGAKPTVKAPDKGDPGISWKGIKSKNSKTALKKAHAEVLNILKTLPSDRRGSRFALLNFANGMEQTVDGNLEKTVSASDAVRQLEKLHDACVKEFLREGVDKIRYNRFLAVSFGPAIGNFSIKLSGQLLPFNPQLTLRNLSIARRRENSSSAPVMISFDGFVVGDDVARIEIVSGGIRFEDLIPKKADAGGYRKFKSKRFDLTGKVLLKVYDTHGRVYQKLYSFYPRARIFENRKGRFLIPKAASEFDNRLDRFFTYQISRESEVSDSFLEKQGFEKF